MGVKLINRVKYNPIIYRIYYYIGNLLIRILSCFIKLDKKLIVFVSFGGRKYDDSPRCIYEKMIEDKRFYDYRLVWAYIEPNKHTEYKGEKVKIDTIRYFKILLKAGCWITNSSVERGLSFKRKHTLYINTWHGSAIKKMGSDLNKDNQSFVGLGQNNTDIMLAQGQYDVDVFSRVFNLPREKFIITGLPRNDELVSYNTTEKKNIIKKKLGIYSEKKIILYAPTFREYLKDEKNNCIIKLPINLKKWREQLSKDYILLFRAHYEIINTLNIESDDFIINVSDYPNLNELMIVSDLLISDYSSIFFDYSIMCKPMLCFAYDYDEYSSKRGLYFDIRKELNSHIENEDILIENIRQLPVEYEKHEDYAKKFRDKYVSGFGAATYKVLDLLSKKN